LDGYRGEEKCNNKRQGHESWTIQGTLSTQFMGGKETQGRSRHGFPDPGWRNKFPGRRKLFRREQARGKATKWRTKEGRKGKGGGGEVPKVGGGTRRIKIA